jgi:hypothetical protein
MNEQVGRLVWGQVKQDNWWALNGFNPVATLVNCYTFAVTYFSKKCLSGMYLTGGRVGIYPYLASDWAGY